MPCGRGSVAGCGWFLLRLSLLPPARARTSRCPSPSLPSSASPTANSPPENDWRYKFSSAAAGVGRTWKTEKKSPQAAAPVGRV
eukprot:764500-Hanusia_phi.AAC.1